MDNVKTYLSDVQIVTNSDAWNNRLPTSITVTNVTNCIYKP